MPTKESLDQMIRHLTWKQVYGSGTNLTYTEVMEMEFNRAMEWAEWMIEQRDREAAALRKGRRG